MQYMFLIYSAPDAEPTYGTPEFQAMMAGYFAFTEKAKADGVLVSGEGLQPVETATTLRVRAGKTETTDGPFAETREHLGGYYVLNLPDLDTALRYAAMIPSAQHGSIEVRPVMDYGQPGA